MREAKRPHIMVGEVAKPILTAEDVAERERIPLWSVHQKARDGEIPSFKIGRLVRFRLADIVAWEEALVARARQQAALRRKQKQEVGE